MSTATATPRDSTTAKAPQLRGWVHIFSAGTHEDSKGREFTATVEQLDEIIANHALGRAPAVIGHPKGNAPAYAWVDEMRRDGERLFCKFADINPAFDDGVNLGAYRNRSISLVNTKQGLRMRHVGWLGGVPPAIDGLEPEGVEFSAEDEGDVFEFSASDDAASALIWGLDRTASLLRGFRDWVIEKDGIEVADRVLPTWSIDSLAESATNARNALQAHEGSLFSTPTGDPDMTTITQADHDKALAEAREQAAKEAREEAAKNFSAQGAELAELRAQRKTEKIDKVINGLKAAGKLTPAQEPGLREFMRQLDENAVFEFSAAEGTDGKVSKSPGEWLAEFLASGAPVVKLGRREDKGDPGAGVDMEDAGALLKAATDFQKAETEAGRPITIELAMDHVREEHGSLT